MKLNLNNFEKIIFNFNYDGHKCEVKISKLEKISIYNKILNKKTKYKNKKDS